MALDQAQTFLVVVQVIRDFVGFGVRLLLGRLVRFGDVMVAAAVFTVGRLGVGLRFALDPGFLTLDDVG